MDDICCMCFYFQYYRFHETFQLTSLISRKRQISMIGKLFLSQTDTCFKILGEFYVKQKSLLLSNLLFRFHLATSITMKCIFKIKDNLYQDCISLMIVDSFMG